MIENWEYFAVFGFSLAGITSALNFLITHDIQYKKRLDEIEVDIKVNYLEQLIQAIIAKHGVNEQGFTDADINAELHRIFLLSRKFTKCENLDSRNKSSITQLVGLIVAIGVTIAGYPFVSTLSEILLSLYNSIFIVLIFFVIVTIYVRHQNKKKLDDEMNDLETRIIINRGLMEGEIMEEE